jgi:hypothetical protein
MLAKTYKCAKLQVFNQIISAFRVLSLKNGQEES